MTTSFPASAEPRRAARLALLAALLAAAPAAAAPADTAAPKTMPEAPGPTEPGPDDMPRAPPEPPDSAPPTGEQPMLGPDGQPISVPDDGAAAAATRASDRRGAPSPTCARHDSAADPLDLLDKVLDGMRDQGFVVGGRERRTNIRGTACAVRVAGGDPAFLQYQLERTSDDGFVIIVVPTGSREVELIVRPVLDGEDRGVLWANVDHVRVTGNYLPGDDGVRLRRIAGIDAGNIPPAAIGAALQQLGYRSVFEADGAGQLNIVVSPGQSIRRVRVHGHLPLSKREVQRELSVASRPGALAQGRCLTPSRLRNDDNPPVCEPGDGACEQWQRDEVTRLQRYLFDKGYLRGTARVAFACGRSRDEVDLHVYLDKGPAYRVPLSKLKVVGNMPDADKRWIRRAFWPRVKATPFPARITRERVEDSKDRTERQYAEPRDSLIRQTAVPQLTLPYPEIRIETSYDDLKPEDVPKASGLPLTVRVDLGRGVKTSFIGNRSYTDQRLRGQLQLFSRREAPSAQTAVREAANLRAFYQSRGFLMTEVQGRYDEFGSTAPGTLTFVVKEGPVVKIRRVDDKVTRGVPPGILDRIERDFSDERTLRSGGTFTEAGVVDHLNALLTKYADNGYLCATASVRVAFWPEGLDRPGEHATVDVETILRRDPGPTWAERDFNPEGLAALRKLKRADLYVRVTVEPGPRVFTSRRPETIRYLDIPIPGDRDVSNLPTHELGEWGGTRMLRNTPLRRTGDDRPGNVALTPSLDRDVEQAIVDNYRNQGYPVADAELNWLYTDPQSGSIKPVPNARRLADPDIGMCQAFPSGTAVEVGTELSVYEGRRGVFGDTVVRGNFKTRGWVLRRQYAHRPGRLYVREEADDTRSNIDGLGVAESTTLTPYPVGCDLDDDKSEQCVVHQVLEIREAKDISMDIGGGIGFATLDPFYLFLHPKFPNIFGTGWDVDTLGHLGIPQVSQNIPANVPILGDCDGQRCYEQSARGTLTRPRIFGSPIGLDIGGQFQLRETPARGRITSAIGSIGLTYSRNYGGSRVLNLAFGYLIQKSNISQDVVKPAYTPEAAGALASVVNRRDAIVTDRTGALYATINYSTLDNPFNPDKGFSADAQLRFASPYFGGLDWFVRADLSFLHVIPIPRTAGRLNFRYALRYGHAIPLPNLPGGTGSASVPEIWRYWGGGTYDLGIRGILPETMLVDIEEIDLGDGVKRLHYTAQGGHIRALGTFALEVVSRKDFLGGKLAHSLFFDLGILTQNWTQVQLSRDFRRSVGINFLKWNIKFVTLALGYAVLLPNAIAPGNVKPIDDRNGRFIFDVGITF